MCTIAPSYLQCFDAVGWAAGKASGLQKTEWWDAGVVMYLGQGADLYMAQMMPLPLSLASVNPDWSYVPGFTFLVPAHPGVPDKIQEGCKTVVYVCVHVCVHVRVCVHMHVCVHHVTERQNCHQHALLLGLVKTNSHF